MTKELFNKYLENRCTEKELVEVLDWFKNNHGSIEAKNHVFEIWKNYEPQESVIEDKKLNELFDKILQATELDKAKSLQHKKVTILLNWITKAAAVLLIPVLAFLLYTLSSRTTESRLTASQVVDSLEVIAPIGSRTVVHLSDGSEVHLNYGSTLKYPQVFSGNTRGVVLTGEGYFDVAHNPEKPFIVETGKLNIKALGTEFNVQFYPEDHTISTTLVEGKVLLEKIINGEQGKSLGAMKPGQHVNYNVKTGEMTSSMGNVEKYIAWKNGKIIFEDTPIEQIANELSRMFNVDIVVYDNIKDYYYTATFIDEPLFQILDLMTIATPVTYKVLPRKKLPDGTFSKQKIIIERKK